MFDAQDFYTVMLSNTVVGAVVVGLLMALVTAKRVTIGAVLEEQDRFWRRASTAFAGLAFAVATWITFADNWLQLVSDPYRLSRRWESQRIVFDPIDADLRRISVGLVLVLAIAGAMLFARFVGGYALQLSCLLVAVFAWFALFVLRQRLDMVVNTVPEGTAFDLTDIAGFLGFWLLRTGLGVLSIAATWMVITLAVAPVVTLLLDLLHLRTPKVTDEAAGFYAAIGSTASRFEDVPLASRWKPILPR